MELSCGGLHRGNKEKKLICSVLSANYRNILCSAQDIKEPKLTCCVVGRQCGSVELCSAQGEQGSKADLKLLASGSAGGAQAGLLLGGGRAGRRGGLLHPGLGLPQHLQHQAPPSCDNTAFYRAALP